MRSLQQHLEEFGRRGVRVVAISVDPSDVTRQHCQKQGFTYTFLSDAQREVIRRYDLAHPGGGPGGEIARPAEFLIDSTGAMRWVNLTDDYRVRPRPEQILQVLDQMGRTTGSRGS